MKCSKCGTENTLTEFYLIDGGLGFTDERMKICKECTVKFNNSKIRYKYLDGQITAPYYGAKLVIDKGTSVSNIAKRIDNGIRDSSNLMAIQNFLHLLGQNGLSNYSQQMKRIFEQQERN
jgi:hypothetical protein